MEIGNYFYTDKQEDGLVIDIIEDGVCIAINYSEWIKMMRIKLTIKNILNK